MSKSAVEIFESQRMSLVGLAYRMLGTLSDADDVMQEAYLRWTRVEPDSVENPGAFLRAVVTRLCIDHQRTMRARRETYVGPWLPEPIVGGLNPLAEERVEMAESLSMAFLVLLENLAPTERAAYLLRKVFEYDYAEIGGILEKTQANCRQMVHRAEERLRARRPRFDATPRETERLASEFLRACSTGDLDGLMNLLAEDAVLVSDGGGKAIAARRPIQGARNIARFLVGVTRKAPPGFVVEAAIVNGEPGHVARVNGQPTNIHAFEIVAGRITRLFIIRNPDKLTRFLPQSTSIHGDGT